MFRLLGFYSNFLCKRYVNEFSDFRKIIKSSYLRAQKELWELPLHRYIRNGLLMCLKVFLDCLGTIWTVFFQQNHQNFGSHHCHKSTRSLTNDIDFPKIGSRVRFPRLHMKICNGRIDFKFSLKQCSYIQVCGKNTFGAIAGYQKGVNNFRFFLQRMQGCLCSPIISYMEMEIWR